MVRLSGFFVAPRFAWGPGAVEVLGGLEVRSATLVVDPTVARHDGARRVVEELRKSDATVTVEVVAEGGATIAAAERLGARLAERQPDALVAIGGGTTIDLAKAARLRCLSPDVALAALPPLLDVPPGGPRLVAVPTTSGSGADASWTADLVTDDGTPVDVAHRSLVPDWSLLDPAFSASLSPSGVVEGGLETLALAIEAFLSAWSGPFSDALALDAATTVLRRLPHAVRWSDDPDARSALHYAAPLAGLAASNAQRGVAHAIARALEGPTGVGYARLLGILLPSVVDFDHPSSRDRLETLAERARTRDDRSDLGLAARLRRLYGQLSFPLTVRAAGGRVDRAEAERASIVDRSLRSPAVLGNPRIPTREELGELVASALG